ncbi:MAG TPA: NAD-dependent epimerase/dehydratase family protein [Acidimicrobiia bacterium]|nr:NAD-dependent epimerase/dehydratase family protein [Acidimicrobiia bacterium]
MTSVVTGATGVVGSALVRHLLAAGGQVRAVIRPGRRLPAGVEPLVGDVLDYSSLLTAFRGARLVFHVAGVNQMCLRDPRMMYRVNVDGTRNVLRAARAAGVEKLVYTSSAATIGEEVGAIGAEDTVHRGKFNSHYERSKYQAEQVVLTEGRDMDLVTLNPSSVQGPGRATGTGRLLLALAAGRLSTLVDTRLSIVDIDDCARGHLLAANHGRRGSRYLLNSFSMTTQEAVSLIEVVTGRTRRVHYLPPQLASLGAGIVGGAFRLIRRDAPLCTEMARTLRHGHVFDGSRATRELGLIYTEATVTLTRLIEWARGQGLLA